MRLTSNKDAKINCFEVCCHTTYGQSAEKSLVIVGSACGANKVRSDKGIALKKAQSQKPKGSALDSLDSILLRSNNSPSKV